MTRPPASRLWAPGIAFVTLLAQAGCGGGGSKLPATPPLASAEPAEQAPPAQARTNPPTAAAAPVPAPIPAQTPPRSAGPSAPPSGKQLDSHAGAGSAPTESAEAASDDARAKADEQAAASLKWMEERQAKQTEYQQRLAEANQQLTDAEAKLAEGERTLQEFRNPYLPRPKLSEDDAAAVQGKGGAERIQFAQDRLTELRAARDAAQKSLDNLKANSPN